MTREEAREYFREVLRVNKKIGGTSAMAGYYETALAALEDAERVDWIAKAPAWRISMQNWFTGDDIRAAIDEARGT